MEFAGFRHVDLLMVLDKYTALTFVGDVVGWVSALCLRHNHADHSSEIVIGR